MDSRAQFTDPVITLVPFEIDSFDFYQLIPLSQSTGIDFSAKITPLSSTNPDPKIVTENLTNPSVSGNYFDTLYNASGMISFENLKNIASAGINPPYFFANVNGGPFVNLESLIPGGYIANVAAYVNVCAVDTSTSLSGNVITSNATTSAYQWIDCNNGNSFISNETNASFTAIANGSYAVIVTDGACSDTSACVDVFITSISEFNEFNHFTLHPNPTSDKVTISFREILTKAIVTLKNSVGQVVYTQKVNAKATVDLQLNLASGMYFVEVSSDSGDTIATQKLIVK